jgi:integrase
VRNIKRSGGDDIVKKRPANPIKDKERIYDIQDYLKYHNYRDYVLFVLGVTTGYRAGDLVVLRVRDIKHALQSGRLVILEGKKRNANNISKRNFKARDVKLISSTVKILKDYIKDKPDYEFLFKSRKGDNDHITVSHVSRILKDAGEEFGLKNITAHSMRKTYAYNSYINSGKDVLKVKGMLGHSRIEDTEVYLGLEVQEYDELADDLNNLVR